jgi:hypothetical protein
MFSAAVTVGQALKAVSKIQCKSGWSNLSCGWCDVMLTAAVTVGQALKAVSKIQCKSAVRSG